MAHHKRRKRKSSRSGCIMCKPWKANGMKGKRGSATLQERRARAREHEQLNEFWKV